MSGRYHDGAQFFAALVKFQGMFLCIGDKCSDDILRNIEHLVVG